MAGKSKPSMFSIFRNRSFTLLWSGQLISSMGSALTALPTFILTHRNTGFTFGIGLRFLAATCSIAFIGLITGMFAHRQEHPF